MQEYNIKKYQANEQIEKAIKDLTISILVEEHALPFKEHYLEKDYNDANLHIWYAEKDGKVVATMMLKKISNDTGKIENVCCNPEYRGMGIAGKLLEELIQFAKKIELKKLELGTYESLERAINFYKKCGFTEKTNVQKASANARYYELIL